MHIIAMRCTSPNYSSVQPRLKIIAWEARSKALLCIYFYIMGHSAGCENWRHATKLLTGKVLRAVRLCLFSCCFADHTGAFVGRAATGTARQVGRLHWRHRSSLAAGLVVDGQKQLVASTYSGACRTHCLRNTWALLGHADDQETSAPGTTQVSTTTTATATAAAAAAAVAAAASAEVKSTAPSFLTAIKSWANMDDPPQVVLYFAFGANMSPAVLTVKRGVTPVASVPAQALAFATEQRKQHGGKLEAIPAEHEDGERRVCLSFSHRAGMYTARLVRFYYHVFRCKLKLHNRSEWYILQLSRAGRGYPGDMCTCSCHTYQVSYHKWWKCGSLSFILPVRRRIKNKNIKKCNKRCLDLSHVSDLTRVFGLAGRNEKLYCNGIFNGHTCSRMDWEVLTLAAFWISRGHRFRPSPARYIASFLSRMRTFRHPACPSIFVNFWPTRALVWQIYALPTYHIYTLVYIFNTRV